MIEIGTPNFGFDFLRIAKEYYCQKNNKNKLDQAIKIVIFSVVAIEAIANMEAMDFFNGKDLKNFIYYGDKRDKRKISAIIKKWNFIFNKRSIDTTKKKLHLKNLSDLIRIRNELIHFKPHKNQTEKILASKKNKVFGPNGQLYTDSRKTGFKLLKRGVLNKLTLKEARKHYENMDNFVFDFYSHEKKGEKGRTWPSRNFCNEHWGKRSPFWKHRKEYKNI